MVYIIFIRGQHRYKGKFQTGFSVPVRFQLYGAKLPAVARGGKDGELPFQSLKALPEGTLILGKFPELRLCGEELFPVQPQFGGLKVDEPAGQLCPASAVGAEEQLIGPIGEQAAALILDPAPFLPAACLRPVRLFRYRRQIPADDDAVLRQPLLEQGGVGGHGRVGKEAALHAALLHRVCGGKNAHARVVGHGTAHWLPAVTAAAAGSKVQGLNKAVAPQRAEAL